MGIIRVTIWVIGVINLLTGSLEIYNAPGFTWSSLTWPSFCGSDLTKGDTIGDYGGQGGGSAAGALGI